MSPKPKTENSTQVNLLHQAGLSKKTQLEHDDLVECLQRLEAALASPAPGREFEWAGRAGAELLKIEASLQRHILSSEGEGGLFAELDLSRGAVPARVEKLRREHEQLLEHAKRLVQRIQNGEQLPDFAAIRREAADFLAAVRHHYSKEVDLIYECFWLDIGVGD